MSIQLGSQLIERNGGSVYVVAEIGQNHQGSLAIAKEMILAAKASGCDCVKFQKSHLPAKFTKAALQRPYDSEHSWGRTYGEHKTFLEFSVTQFKELQAYSAEIGIDFTASAMDEVSLDQLDALAVPFIKIGSGDTNNFPLLQRAALLKRPLVVSTGMQTLATLDRVVDIMRRANKTNYALLHCVSAYPTAAADASLALIPLLRERYPHITIGYSGHEMGVTLTPAAVLLGARIVERHFTLDHQQKGSDHKCSLEPSQMQELVKQLRGLPLTPATPTLSAESIKQVLRLNETEGNALEQALAAGNSQKVVLACELSCKRKLGKSLVAARTVPAGHLLQPGDMAVKVSEPNGLPAEELPNAEGRRLIEQVLEDEPILVDNLQL